ncbi:MAG: aryldialkylphosphatase [Thaumarchaeota archaeon]|nr:aryldialkylphosphatase [Nitrososphaerota archaeon]
MSRPAGKAQTVLGPVEPSELGTTLMHEHLFLDIASHYFVAPEDPVKRRMALAPLGLDNLGWVRGDAMRNLDNLHLDDMEMMAKEARRFRNAGGNTIVDVTTIGLARAPTSLRELSLRTGLNIVAGAGYYISRFHPPEVAGKSVEDIRSDIVRDITVGMDGTQVRAGIIGEIGTTYPWGTNEEKVLRGAARAQLETGAALMVHPGRNPAHPQLILDVLEEEHADMKRVIIAHIERTIGELSQMKAVMDRGATIEFDVFGYFGTLQDLPFPDPNDQMRVHMVKQLVDAGYADRILISQDICEKQSLYCYGGFGYAHILENVVPLMRRRGMTQETIDRILVDNPRRFLTLVR